MEKGTNEKSQFLSVGQLLDFCLISCQLLSRTYSIRHYSLRYIVLVSTLRLCQIDTLFAYFFLSLMVCLLACLLVVGLFWIFFFHFPRVMHASRAPIGQSRHVHTILSFVCVEEGEREGN